jgi:FkbM family methyltransferase
VRSTLRYFGYEIHRTQPNPVRWLRGLGIRTVLDIGANTGQFAALARRAFPEAHIVSFEPIPECYAELRRNFERDSRFSAFNLALGADDHVATFNRHDFSPASSLLGQSDLIASSFPHATKMSVTEVEVRTLDGVAATLRLDKEILIKIDVQGYEDRVIAGGVDVLREARVIIIEVCFEPLYEGQLPFGGIHQLLTSGGFSYAGNLAQSRHPQDGRNLEADAIYVRL